MVVFGRKLPGLLAMIVAGTMKAVLAAFQVPCTWVASAVACNAKGVPQLVSALWVLPVVSEGSGGALLLHERAAATPAPKSAVSAARTKIPTARFFA